MVKTGGNQRQYFPGQEDPPSVAGLSAALSQRDRGIALCGMTGSGVNRACSRFENMMERGKDLRGRLKRLTGDLK